jgi:hypothetical protein
MVDSNLDPRPVAPTKAQLKVARAALKAQQKEGDYLCGCFTALCRDPFFPPLISHWQKYHPNSLAILENAQAWRSATAPRPEAATEGE